MKRFSLAAQVAIIVALALFIAQAINFGFAVKNRHDQLVNNAALPAVERLTTAISNVDRLEARPALRRMARRERVSVSNISPVPPGAHNMPVAANVIRDGLSANGIVLRDLKVIELKGAQRRQRATLMVAAQLEDGRWISLRGPGPRPLGPVLGILIIQYFIIGLLVLLPTLWLLRRTSRSLRRVTKAAEEFDGSTLPEPVPVKGPRDVRALIRAMNSMETRIAEMIGEKDVMLGAIGHDLRTPLTALRIEAETIEDENKREALVTQIESLHEQFEQILEFARLGRSTGEKSEIALEPLLRTLAEAHDEKARVDDIAPVMVCAQPGPLKRAISNLINNAIQYGEDAVISAVADADMAVITIRDHGPGIAPEDREKALMPFGRLDASRNAATGGHGLGLSIVAAVARAQGGRLELGDPEEGKGLEARLIIPRLS